VYTGRVHPEKGIHLLVDAFRRLSSTFPQGLQLRIVGATSVAGGGGGDEYLAKLKAAANGLNVQFLEPIYDRTALVRELQSADIYCYPSMAEVGEAMPVAPLEALATGLPAVTSDLPQFMDYLRPGENGLTFDRRSADPAGELARALRTLVDDLDMRQRFGQQAIASASRFDTASVAKMYLGDFQSLL
jgi:glycosyltransferase involved in cell wall biosynthesis